MAISVRQAQSSEVGVVAELVHALLSELTPPTATPPTIDKVRASTVLLLNKDRGVWAFVAEDELGHAVGVLTLHECASIYAGGRFGEISELFVSPPARSEGVGPELLKEAMRFARAREWRRLEVGAPAGTHWNRTVSFYLRNGFEEVGPRLKCLL
jgi:GNAT superfamily N-acetyltransferase